jgi:hypothetical protein
MSGVGIAASAANEYSLSPRVKTATSELAFVSTKDAIGVSSSVLEIELGKIMIATAKIVHALAPRAPRERALFFRLQDDAGVGINTVATEPFATAMLTEAL